MTASECLSIKPLTDCPRPIDSMVSGVMMPIDRWVRAPRRVIFSNRDPAEAASGGFEPGREQNEFGGRSSDDFGVAGPGLSRRDFESGDAPVRGARLPRDLDGGGCARRERQQGPYILAFQDQGRALYGGTEPPARALFHRLYGR